MHLGQMARVAPHAVDKDQKMHLSHDEDTGGGEMDQSERVKTIVSECGLHKPANVNRYLMWVPVRAMTKTAGMSSQPYTRVLHRFCSFRYSVGPGLRSLCDIHSLFRDLLDEERFRRSFTLYNVLKVTYLQ